MKRVLVTGGIGSGKSYVISVMNAMGIPSYDSDSRVKGLYESDSALLGKIKDILGESVVENGHLQRKRFAELIFNNDEKKRAVEDVVFPAVIEDFDRWCRMQQCDMVILESAIALEKPVLRISYDEALVVLAPLETRIERAINRDNATKDQILSRISNQWSDEQRESVADYIVINDGVAALLPQIEEYVNRR